MENTETKNNNMSIIIEDIVKTISLKDEATKKGLDFYSLGMHQKVVCPFHGDTDPSMVLYEGEHPHFHCFGCGKHLDVFWFVHEWGKMNDSDWNFSKTLKYFKTNYNIKSIGNTDEIDNSFLDEERKYKETKEDDIVYGDYYRTSNIIRRYLRSSPNPSFDLSKIKNITKKIDNIVFSSKKEKLDEKEKVLENLFSKLDGIRYSDDIKQFSNIVKGNPDSRFIIIVSKNEFEVCISSILMRNKTENDYFIIVLSEENDKQKIIPIIKSTFVSKCIVFGKEAYTVMFENKIGEFDKIINTRKEVKVSGKTIEFVFVNEKYLFEEGSK